MGLLFWTKFEIVCTILTPPVDLEARVAQIAKVKLVAILDTDHRRSRTNLLGPIVSFLQDIGRMEFFE